MPLSEATKLFGIEQGLNMINQGIEYGRTKKLMDIQQRNQMALNVQGQALQLDTWEKTNYPAQVAMMQQAGLNPGLLYSKGGTGGTTGGQTGGSATGGQAPRAMPMNIASILEMKNLAAQEELIKAETRLKDAEARKMQGVDTELAGVQIRESEGRIALNLTQASLNRASEALKGKEMEVADTVKRLNDSLTGLNDQKVQESIAKTSIDNKTLDWMKETGLNPNDGQIAKTITYLANETGLAEDTLIYILGGAIGVKELLKLIPQFLVKKLPDKILNSAPIRGFGK